MKILKLAFLALVCMLPSVQLAQNFTNTTSFTFNSMQIFTSSFIYQVLDDLALYNLNDCMYQTYEVSSALFSSLNGLFGFRLTNATLEFGEALHRTPVALNLCLKLVDTKDDNVQMVEMIQFKDTKKSLIWFGLNLLFNGVDII